MPGASQESHLKGTERRYFSPLQVAFLTGPGIYAGADLHPGAVAVRSEYGLSPGRSAMPLRSLSSLSLLVLLTSARVGADPPADTARGDKMRDAYFRKQVQVIAD